MKLIDILVRELKSWPDHIHCMTQDSDGDLNWHNNKCSPELNDEAVTWKCDESWVDYFHGYEIADDWKTAIITRDQYESALAESQKVEWSGDGLPPVGCECEYQWAGDEWKSGKICYISKQTVLISEVFEGEESESAFGLDDVKFRPLRSEADKKRDNAVEAIDYWLPEFIPDTPNDFYHAKKLYDAISTGKIPGVKLED